MNKLAERRLECLRQPAGTRDRDKPGDEQESQGQPLTSFSGPERYEAGWRAGPRSRLRTGTLPFFLTASGSERKNDGADEYIQKRSAFVLRYNKARVLYLKGAHEGLVHTHHAACIVKLPAVVGGGEQRHQLSLGKELITVFNNLYGSKITDETSWSRKEDLSLKIASTITIFWHFTGQKY